MGILGRIGLRRAGTAQNPEPESEDSTPARDLVQAQRVYLPLDQDQAGNRLATGGFETNRIEAFWYHQPVSGLSGTHLDWRPFAERKHLLVFTESTDRTVLGALSAIQIATVVRSWAAEQTPGSTVDRLAYLINGLLHERDSNNRCFGLFCSVSDHNKAYQIVGAGSPGYVLYEDGAKTAKVVSFGQSPWIGEYPSTEIRDSAFPFVSHAGHLEPGDMLLFVTERSVTDSAWIHSGGKEEFGNERIISLVNAVMSEGRWQLARQGCRREWSPLTFNFTGIQPLARNAVLALASAETLFRSGSSGEARSRSGSRCETDVSVTAFLRDYWEQYADLLGKNVQESRDGLVDVSSLELQRQTADIAVMAVRRKRNGERPRLLDKRG